MLIACLGCKAENILPLAECTFGERVARVVSPPDKNPISGSQNAIFTKSDTAGEFAQGVLVSRLIGVSVSGAKVDESVSSAELRAVKDDTEFASSIKSAEEPPNWGRISQ
jgi:hypothetical protein